MAKVKVNYASNPRPVESVDLHITPDEAYFLRALLGKVRGYMKETGQSPSYGLFCQLSDGLPEPGADDKDVYFTPTGKRTAVLSANITVRG